MGMPEKEFESNKSAMNLGMKIPAKDRRWSSIAVDSYSNSVRAAGNMGRRLVH
jgi:hypothetical protein